MSKKDFKGGIDSLLGDKPVPKKRGRPRTQFKEITKTTQIGTKEGEIRATFLIDEAQLEKVKAIAWYERRKIKDIIGEALKKYIGSRDTEVVNKATKEYKLRSSRE